MIRKSSTLPPIIENANPSEYRKLGEQFERGDARRTMNNSQLRDFSRCPHRWKLGTVEDESDSLEWGALLDCLVTTPDRYEKTYAVAPETFTTVPNAYVLTTDFPGEYNSRQKVCQQWKKAKEAEGFTVLTPEKLEEAKTPRPWSWQCDYCKDWRTAREKEGKIAIKSELAAEAWKATRMLWKDKRIAAFLTGAKTQVQVNAEWHDPDTGLVIPLKCLIDIVPDPKGDFGMMLGDLKSARSASPGAWTRAVFDHGYHSQAALYLDAYNAATGLKYRDFAHVVQENEPPYETARRILSPEYLQLGRAEYQRALVDYCYCVANNFWPGYDDKGDDRGNILDGWRIVEPIPWMILGGAEA